MSMILPEEEHQRRKRNADRSSQHERIARIIDDYKRCLRCVVCNEDDPCCLDFHHANPQEKEFTVSDFIRRFSLDRLMNEIAKCRVLCANCHRKYHAGKIILP